jgi:hypothetical protein
MCNIANNSSVTFEVYIGKRESINSNDYTSYTKASLELKDVTASAISGYRIFIENGDQVFQYDEYGNAPTEGKFKDPQIILPLKAHLFTPENLEVTNNNFKVK